MKNKILIATAIILNATSLIYSQEEKKVKRFTVHDYTFQATGYYAKENKSSLSDFKQLAPASVLLNEFPNSSIKGGLSLKSNQFYSLLIGIQLNTKNNTSCKGSPILRLGISSGYSTTISSDYRLQNTARYDTITFSQNGNSFFLDSTFSEYYSMNYSAHQIKLNASLNFTTKPEKRWSLFGGIGVAAGISVDAKTDIYRSIQRDVSLASGQTMNTPYLYNSQFTNGYFTGPEMKSESFKNKTNTTLAAFIPLGVDFRLGKLRDFYKKIHLFYEFRPTVTYTFVPELRSFCNLSLQHSLGIRYVLK
jgi:hypothetical protein